MTTRMTDSVRVRRVCAVVAQPHDLAGSMLLLRTNERHITGPRHLAMYFCQALFGWSLPRIGHAFGGYNHSTVLHGIRRVRSEMLADEEYSAAVLRLEETIRQAEAEYLKQPARKLNRIDVLEAQVAMLNARIGA